MQPDHNEIPHGYCHCGCGEKTTIARDTNPARQRVKGEPQRYIKGHHARSSPHEYLTEDRGYATPCWIWQRGINPSGYGVASSNGRTRIAHRLTYEKAHGPVADDMELHHQCEVRACVNPNHLLPVTPAEHGRFSVKATKTHCINGHEFTPENTYHRPDAPHRRTCIACERERTRRLRAKRGRYA